MASEVCGGQMLGARGMRIVRPCLEQGHEQRAIARAQACARGWPAPRHLDEQHARARPDGRRASRAGSESQVCTRSGQGARRWSARERILGPADQIVQRRQQAVLLVLEVLVEHRLLDFGAAPARDSMVGAVIAPRARPSRSSRRGRVRVGRGDGATARVRPPQRSVIQHHLAPSLRTPHSPPGL